jgi:hypothetical protein
MLLIPEFIHLKLMHKTVLYSGEGRPVLEVKGKQRKRLPDVHESDKSSQLPATKNYVSGRITAVLPVNQVFSILLYDQN